MNRFRRIVDRLLNGLVILVLVLNIVVSIIIYCGIRQGIIK